MRFQVLMWQNFSCDDGKALSSMRTRYANWTL
jgi:hypothetical protein